MIQGLVDCIKQMSIFLLCAKVLLYLKPKGCYEKYIKLLVSIMLLSQFLMPVMGWFSGKGQAGMWDTIEKYEKQFQELDANAAGTLNDYETIWGILANKEAEKLRQEQMESTYSLEEALRQEEEQEQGSIPPVSEVQIGPIQVEGGKEHAETGGNARDDGAE